MDELTLRPYAPGDEAGILASFNLVFREVCGPGYVDRDLTHWRWQFAENPAGHRIQLAVAPDGTIAGQYAALPVRAVTPQGPTVFSQIVDSFVHPAYRQELKRPGVFALTARAALEHWIGLGDGMFHGMPVEAARKVSVRLLAYTTWRSVDYLVRDARDGTDAGPSDVDVALVERAPGDLDELALALAREKRFCNVRDAAYLDWRYLHVPVAHYELHVARRAGRACGAMVLRPRHELLGPTCTMAELLVPRDDHGALDALLARATARAREVGRRLAALFPPQAPETGALHARGFETEPSAATFFRSIGCRLAQPGLDFVQLGELWWYSFGDFDLV